MTENAGTGDVVARLSGISHRYGDTAVLHDVSLEIAAGKVFGLIGPDGVGKSTLLGLAAGARRIQSGVVEVLGGDLADSAHRRAACHRIAYMPQGLGRNLYGDLSVFENLNFFGRLFGQSRAEREQRIEELVTAVGLAPFVDRHAINLSGGMKQKLGLCCALIHDPDFLVLDEPTTGVDPLSRRQFWRLIEKMRQRWPRMSLFVATAYMDEAARFDTLAMMHAGRILAQATPDEIMVETGADTIERAYIAMLPEASRRGHHGLTIPPRKKDDGEPAIEARGLTRRFGDFTAVDNVSFRIERGEIFGFLGSNGCGKTTTMKMLTGLLPASEGDAWLFGHRIDAKDIETRRRVGFMSQTFSLYGELTVHQNLDLHAHLFHLPRERVPIRVAEMVERFGLEDVVEARADSLPLGIRQRLSLAVAVIHAPEMLILDEPTSGVDPVARDAFWQLLVDLSRDDGVTIFISTHFMNEAERCDRISLMHAGRVLAEGPPATLVRDSGTETLQDAFIAALEAVGGEGIDGADGDAQAIGQMAAPGDDAGSPTGRRLDLSRAWAYAHREGMEILRDPIRLAFALVGPIVLMMALGYGISFDVERLPYAVLDFDQSPASRVYAENFSGSRYFVERPAAASQAELERRLRSGEITVAVEIPPGFGKDLKRGRRPEVGVWLDGGNPFRGETSRGYVQGIHQRYLEDLARTEPQLGQATSPAITEVRFRYNQAFKSVFAMVPGVIMLLLAMIPAMMTAVGVVREKEMGSITNLYVTPVTGLEFLIGKQVPYVVVALVNFATLLLLSILLFKVPVKGSFLALFLGALLYVIATTGFGLLMSSFLRTQIAALFGTAILTVVPSINFSGFMSPVSSLTGGASVMAYLFPSGYFQKISVGTISKALGFTDLAINYLALGVFACGFLLVSVVLLKTQED